LPDEPIAGTATAAVGGASVLPIDAACRQHPNCLLPLPKKAAELQFTSKSVPGGIRCGKCLKTNASFDLIIGNITDISIGFYCIFYGQTDIFSNFPANISGILSRVNSPHFPRK
jgi:hypothetical protein